MTMSNHEALSRRGTRQVIDDHFTLRQRGMLEEDLARNYHPDVVLLSAEGGNHGHDAVRYLADILQYYADGARYQCQQLLVDGEVGLLEWTGQVGADIRLRDGADTFIVRDGLITVQTIHYSTVR